MLTMFVATGGAGQERSESDYRATGSVFEERVGLSQEIGTVFALDSDWRMAADAFRNGTRDSSNGYSSDRTNLALAVGRSLRSWLSVASGLTASQEVFSRSSRVEQAAQEFNLSGRIEGLSGFSVADTLGAFWFRTDDHDALGPSIQANRGFENIAVLEASGRRGAASLSGDLRVKSQFAADFPASTINGRGAFNYTGRRLDIDVDAGGKWARDFPVSEVLRGFEKRITEEGRVTSTVNHTAFSERLDANLTLETRRSDRRYIDQPHKDRREEDDSLVARLLYEFSRSKSISLEIERGFFREIDARPSGGELDRRVEKRGIGAGATWEPGQRLSLTLDGSRQLHRTDHRGGFAGDDEDDLGDVFDADLTLRPGAGFELNSRFAIDRLQERHLRAEWAAFSLDRTAYTSLTTLSYEPADSLHLIVGTTLLSTFTDYLHDADESAILLDRRVSSKVVWRGRDLGASFEARLRLKTRGDLIESSSGDVSIRPKEESVISALDLELDRSLDQWGNVALGWIWTETAVRGNEPTPVHDLSLDVGLVLHERGTFDLILEERIRSIDQADRFRTDISAALRWGF